MNPFTSIPAVIKTLDEIKKYNKHIPEFERLRAAGDLEGERALIQKASGDWAVGMSRRLKITYDIEGEENIPESGPIMVYANHQSYADAIAMYYLFRNHFQIGFIAKNEFRKLGPIAKGVEYTRSVFLVRDGAKAAVQAIHESTELLQQGFSLCIFPEGTRSRSSNLLRFRNGSLKFAQKGKVPILPITLDGGYKLYEIDGSYHPCHIKIKVHPLVHIENMNKHEQLEAYEQIKQSIADGLK